jgi:AcrR family transcriptional regulator
MAASSTTKRAINTQLQNVPKRPQRERLLAGMVASANRTGYGGANVSEVIAHAGVSRRTFYAYFADRDECYLATLTDVQQRLLGEVRRAVKAHAAEDAFAAAVEALVRFAIHEPKQAQFLALDALTGTPEALDARDHGITEIARIVADALAQAPAGKATPDLPLEIALGAIQRLLASRLRRGERTLGGMVEELLAWSQSYSQPAHKHRWRAPAADGTVAPSPFVSPTPLHAPPPIPRGRPQLSTEEIAENHRQRIMVATCQVVYERGYHASTIVEIAQRSGVGGRAFYSQFNSKQEPFSAVYELGYQHLMSTAADAFFAGTSWPERIWETMRATTQTLQRDPAIAQLGFVAALAVGPWEVQRVEDSRAAFTIFLQEGLRHDPTRPPPSRLALDAIVASVFELVYRAAREQNGQPEFAGLLGPVMHLCLTPFMGAGAANRFIDRKAGAREG